MTNGIKAIHSMLASKQAKDLARRLTGARYRDGLYRVAYNIQAVASLVGAACWFSRLPDRELYRAWLPLSWLLRAGQVGSLGVLLSGVRVIGIMGFAGVTRLRGFLSGLDLGPEPEAQRSRRSTSPVRWGKRGPSASPTTRATWGRWGSSCSCRG